MHALPGLTLKIPYFAHAGQSCVLCGSSNNSLHSILLRAFITTSHSAVYEVRSVSLYMMYVLLLRGLIYLSSYNVLAAADKEVFGIDLKPFTGYTSL